MLPDLNLALRPATNKIVAGAIRSRSNSRAIALRKGKAMLAHG
jgi:hypothetical protein